METEQQELIKQLLEQKQMSLKNFAIWNKSTRINLKNSKNILDKLFKRIDANIKSSQIRYDLVLEFFKKMQFQVVSSVDFSKHISNFEVMNVIIENGNMIQNKNETFKKGIKCFEKNFNSFQDEVKLFEKRVEIQIINKILAKKFKETEQGLDKQCQQIEKHNKLLQKISLDTQNLQKQFLQTYENSIKQNKKVQFDQSFLLEQFLSLLSNIFKISQFLQKFTTQFIDLHQQTIVLEKTRNNAIKDSLVVFINMVHNFFGEEKSKLFRESKELLLNISLDQFAEDSFNIQKLLNKQEIEIVLEQTNQREMDINVVKLYLNQSLEIEQQNILKQFYVDKYEGTAVSGIKSKFLKVQLFLDHNLNYYICLMDNDTIKEIKYKFNIQDCKMSTQHDNNTILIEFKEKGWFWNSSKTVEIRLSNDDLEICKSVYRNYNSAFNRLEVQFERRNSEQIRQVDLSISENSSFDNNNEQDLQIDLNENQEEHLQDQQNTNIQNNINGDMYLDENDQQDNHNNITIQNTIQADVQVNNQLQHQNQGQQYLEQEDLEQSNVIQPNNIQNQVNLEQTIEDQVLQLNYQINYQLRYIREEGIIQIHRFNRLANFIDFLYIFLNIKQFVNFITFFIQKFSDLIL